MITDVRKRKKTTIVVFVVVVAKPVLRTMLTFFFLLTKAQTLINVYESQLCCSQTMVYEPDSNVQIVAIP